MKRFLLLILLLSSIVTSAVAETNDCSFISDKQAIEIAKQYAIEHKIRDEDWFTSYEEDYSAEYSYGKWSVFFERTIEGKDKTRSVILGDHFTITLTSDGKVLEFFPGL